jgi:PHD/YefM family antitoxin component YafN of YafNO toxin-antitoxin module
VSTIAMDKPVFSKDQMISSTAISREFGLVRKKAYNGPLAILERNTPSLILMSYNQYEKIYEYVQELEEEIVKLKALKGAAELEKDPSCGIPWRNVRLDD